MIRDETLTRWSGRRLDDSAGNRIGTVLDVIRDPETDLVWVAASLSRFRREPATMVPGSDAIEGDGALAVPYAKDLVHGAPRSINEADWTTPSYRSQLYKYYELTNVPRRRGATA